VILNSPVRGLFTIMPGIVNRPRTPCTTMQTNVRGMGEALCKEQFPGTKFYKQPNVIPGVRGSLLPGPARTTRRLRGNGRRVAFNHRTWAGPGRLFVCVSVRRPGQSIMGVRSTCIGLALLLRSGLGWDLPSQPGNRRIQLGVRSASYKPGLHYLSCVRRAGTFHPSPAPLAEYLGR
jgi:hypothetical protein